LINILLCDLYRKLNSSLLRLPSTSSRHIFLGNIVLRKANLLAPMLLQCWLKRGGWCVSFVFSHPVDVTAFISVTIYPPMELRLYYRTGTSCRTGTFMFVVMLSSSNLGQHHATSTQLPPSISSPSKNTPRPPPPPPTIWRTRTIRSCTR